MPASAHRRTRETYADLVLAVLDARQDAASARFDAVLAEAEAAGRVDATTARHLRWWQRASVRAVVEHAAATLPGTLTALDAADIEADGSAEQTAAAWARAARPTTASTRPGAPAGAPDPDATPARTFVADLALVAGPVDPAHPPDTPPDPGDRGADPVADSPARPVPGADAPPSTAKDDR
ncbi:MAG: hypothetical protein EPO13_02710 [Actinomycetota bacterium]|nr:MAG: hypothetical protein EPO13_02710 [Actinomycetota bacterium]